MKSYKGKVANKNEIVKKRSQDRSEETRKKILKTAAMCFSNKSYDRTSVANICELAGVSKGAFFYHFPTKKSVFLILLDNWLKELDASIEEIIKTSKDIPEALLRMTGIIKIVTNSSGGQLPLFLQFWSEASHDEDIWQATVSHYKKYQKYFSKVLDRGMKEGSIKKIDSKIASNVIVSFAVGLLLQELIDTDREDWDMISKEGFKIILDSIKR
jgi:TetR/AcrR family fatty acid metabolism transcriptional regulator